MENNDDLPSIESLDARIQQAKGADLPPPEAEMSGYAVAMRLAVDLLAGVIVGGLIGYALDSVFETSPLLLIICILLGAAGGMRNLIRTSKRLDKGLN